MDTSLLVAGALQTLVAWAFFRLPGKNVLAVTPIWRANQSLTPVGVALWVGGFSLIVAGMFVTALAYILHGTG